MKVLNDVSVKVEQIIHSFDKKEKFYESYPEKLDEIIALKKEIFDKRMLILNQTEKDKKAKQWIKNEQKSLERKRASLDAHFIAFKFVELITSGEKSDEMLKFVFDSGSFNIEVLPKGQGIAILNFVRTKGGYVKYTNSYITPENLEPGTLNLIEKITPIVKTEFMDIIKSYIIHFEKMKLAEDLKVNAGNDMTKRL